MYKGNTKIFSFVDSAFYDSGFTQFLKKYILKKEIVIYLLDHQIIINIILILNQKKLL